MANLQIISFVIIGLCVAMVIILTLAALKLKAKFKSSKFFRNASNISNITNGNKVQNPIGPSYTHALSQQTTYNSYVNSFMNDQSAESEFQTVVSSQNLSVFPTAPLRYSLQTHFYFSSSRQDKSGWPKKRSQKCTPYADKDRMLWDSIRRDRPDILQQALIFSPNITANSTYGYSVLHVCAVMCKKPTVADMLLNLAPHMVNARTTHGTTPLMQAMEHSHLVLANTLIARGADINAQDSMGRTALMRGAAAGNSIAAKFLLAFHADPNVVDRGGRRAVDIALLCGNARVASDLQGSALAVVPGYISPNVQTTFQAFMLLVSILAHFADVTTDVLLLLNLWSTRRNLAIATAVFVFLPSVLVAAIPYQSLIERLLTILQLRIVYEALISMNQERLTVRYGAVQMLHTVLENIPQMIIQAFIFAEEVQRSQTKDDDTSGVGDDNSNNDDHGKDVNITLVILALLSSLFSSAKKIQSMYLKRFDNSLRDKLNVGGVGVAKKSWKDEFSVYLIVSLLYTFSSMAVRLTAYTLVLVYWHPVVFAVVMGWVLLSRLRIAALPIGNPRNRTNLEWTSVDLIAACLTDTPFAPNYEALVMSSTLSLIELVIIFLGMGLFWPKRCILMFVSLVVWWGLHLYMLLIIHGKHFTIPTRRALWIDFLCFWRLTPLLSRLLGDMGQGILDTLRFYWGRISSLLCGGGSTGVGPLQPLIAPPPVQAAPTPTSNSPVFKLSRLLKREMMAGGIFIAMVFCLVSWIISSGVAHCRHKRSGDDNFLDDQDDVYVSCAGSFDTGFGDFGLSVAPILLLILYLVQIGETLTCPVAAHMKHLMFEEKYYECFLQARALEPSITWHSEAWHMEKRTTTIRNSNGTTSTVTREVRVTTNVASKNYQFDAWVDTSSSDFPTGSPYAQISSESKHFFHDKYSVDDYNREYDAFMRANNTDVRQDKSTFFYTGGITGPPIPKCLVYSTELKILVKYTYLLYATLLGLSFFYRWYITSLATDHTVTITKSFRKYPPNGPRPNPLTNYAY